MPNYFFRGYHGTRSTNIEKIAANGLLKVGNPKNPSKSTDEGFFGDPKYGVYISRYMEYALKYSNNLRPLNPGGVVKIVRFRLVPGRCCHIQKLSKGILPTKGYHSHHSSNFLEWYLFDERQCHPDAILEVEAIENNRTYADDGTPY